MNPSFSAEPAPETTSIIAPTGGLAQAVARMAQPLQRLYAVCPDGWNLLLLLALAALVLGWNLGGYPLFDLDEPRYPQAAREMWQSGNWITPYFNGQVRFDKPPFYYWCEILSFMAMGVNPLAARAVSAFCGLLVAGLIYGTARIGGSTKNALMAGVICLTLLQPIAIARLSVPDMMLSLWLTATFGAFVLTVNKHRAFWLLAAFFAALGMLTKGPVALALPGAIFMAYAGWSRQFKRLFLNHWFVLALLLWVSLSLPWFVAAYHQNGQPFLDALYLHNVTRYTGDVSGHKAPWYYFLLVLPVGALPWSLSFPSLAVWIKAQLGFWRKAETPEAQTLGLALFWTLGVFLFFSAGQSKLITYITPLYSTLALLLGYFWHDQLKKFASTKTLKITGGVFSVAGSFCLVLLLALLALPVFLPDYLPVLFFRILPVGLNLPWVSLFIMAATLTIGLLAIGRAFWQAKLPQAFVLQALTMAVFIPGLYQSVFPIIGQLKQADLLTYAQLAAEKPIATVNMARPSLTFTLNRPIEAFLLSNPELDPKADERLHRWVDEKTAKEPLLVMKNKVVPEVLPQLQRLGVEVFRQQRGFAYTACWVRPLMPAQNKRQHGKKYRRYRHLAFVPGRLQVPKEAF